MNKLLVPPSPNWYEPNIAACSPDNTLIYGSRNDIVVIKQTRENQPDDIQLILKAHSQRVIYVSLNQNWGQPNKLAVTVSEDKIVKLWNIDTLEKQLSHNKHASTDKIIGAVFAGDDRVVSVSEDGMIVVWNIVLNDMNVLNLLTETKICVTNLSACPHANWLVAFGLKNGLVIIADLRKSGKILYKLRGHNKSVVSLSWCPVPLNIFPTKPRNYVGVKKFQDCIKNVENPTKNSFNYKELEEKEKIANEEKQMLPNTEDSLSKNETYITENSMDSQSKTELESRKCLQLKSIILASSPVVENEILDDPKFLGTLESPILKEVDKRNSLTYCIMTDTELNCNSNLAANADKSTESDENVDFKFKTANDHFSDRLKNTSDSGISSDSYHTAVGFPDNKESENIVSDQVLVSTTEVVSEEEEPRKEFLLASSAREGNIYIWRAGTDGRMQTFFSLPSKSHSKKSRTLDKLWITITWVTPNVLLSTSKSGEVLQWNLPKPKEFSKLIHLIHKDHHRLIFNISAPVKYLTENNWQEEQTLNVWSIGQDRLVINTNLSKEKKNLNCYPTFGGCVSCFAGSPLDPNRLAFGTNDACINVWDLSREHTKRIVFNHFYQKIQSKVTALAWHPVTEMNLAYATMEGRIGIIDTYNSSKSPRLLPDFFKSSIHKVEWGPLHGNKEDVGLYVVAEGKVAIFNCGTNIKEPQLLETPDMSIYTIAWKPDYKTLLASSKCGSLIVYSSDQQKFQIYYLQQKIQSIIWHPDASGEDSAVSKYCNVFACIVKSSQFAIYDMSVVSENHADKMIFNSEYRGVVLNSIAWSPHTGSQLVIADEEGICQVFDIETKTIVATYLDPHFDGIVSTIWSPIDPDYIIIGTVAQKLVVWKVSENPTIPESDISTKRNKVLKEISKEALDLLPAKEKSEEAKQGHKAVKSTKSSTLSLFYSVKDDSSQITDLKKLLLWKTGKKLVEPAVDESKYPDILNIFGTQTEMHNIFDAKIKCLQQRGQYHKANMLSLFKGDIQDAIKIAIEQKRVDPWLISLCPMVSSNRIWQTACETYVQQLQEKPDSDPLQIVTYLLACHKVEESIQVLCENAMFREALVLAKFRFPDDDPIVNEVIEKWAKNSTATGCFEMAAQCYIVLGKFEQAASVLFRRSNLELLEVAIELASMSDNEELHKAVKFRYNAFKENQEKPKGDAPATNGEKNSENLQDLKDEVDDSANKTVGLNVPNRVDSENISSEQLDE